LRIFVVVQPKVIGVGDTDDGYFFGLVVCEIGFDIGFAINITLAITIIIFLLEIRITSARLIRQPQGEEDDDSQ